MRILILSSNLNQIGGISRYNRFFFNALNELNGEVVLIELADARLSSKIKFSWNFLSKSYSFKPNYIVCTHINFSPLCYLWSFFNKTDYIITTYGIEVWDLKNPIFKRALKNAKAIIAISRFTRDKLIAQSSKLRDKIFLLPNSVDGDRFKPQKKEDALIEKFGFKGKKIILTVTRLLSSEAYKGCDKIIEALPQVIKFFPNLNYLIVGRGDDLPRLEKLVHAKKIENYVTFMRDVPDDDLVAYYNLCDLFAMPSKGEGFGFVFIEAMSCGKPVIGGCVDGSCDALLDGELGVMVNPDATEEISDALINVLGNKVSARLVNSSYLRETVLRNYGKDKFREKVSQLLHELSR